MFIVFEGIDGSGKTTLSAQFAQKLRDVGLDALWTCEPTYEGRFGQEIRKMLRGNEPMLEASQMTLLYAIDRAQHLESVVRPALAEGKIVVCDRYVLSNIGYQSSHIEDDAKRAQARAWIASVNGFAPQPDLTILLTVDPEVARARIAARGPLEHYDDESKSAFRARLAAFYYESYEASAHVDAVINTSLLSQPDALVAVWIAAQRTGRLPGSGSRGQL